jgi:hypothetical protein
MAIRGGNLPPSRLRQRSSIPISPRAEWSDCERRRPGAGRSESSGSSRPFWLPVEPATISGRVGNRAWLDLSARVAKLRTVHTLARRGHHPIMRISPFST